MSQNNSSTLYLGIDVAKDSLEPDPLRLPKLGTLPNCPQGLRRLLKALKLLLTPTQTPHVVLEATGGYEQALVEALHTAGVRVSVMPAHRIRDHARSLGQFAKTDRIDAAIISSYADSARPLPDKAPTATEKELRELCRRRQQLIELRTRDQNRDHRHSLPLLVKGASALRKLLSAQIKAIDQRLAELRREDQLFNAKVEALAAIDGVGVLTAVNALAAVPELGTLSRNATSALAGLAPYPRDSGTHSSRRFIHGGRVQARQAIYMAALCASRRNPVLAPLYQRLLHAGKPFKLAITAVMRRLLIYMNSTLAQLLQPLPPPTSA
jgi:transposase